MHAQLQLLVALQDMDQMIRETVESREQLEDLVVGQRVMSYIRRGE